MGRAGALVFAWMFANAAHAETPKDPAVAAELAALDAETHCYVSPGPVPGETRALCVWRPKATPPTTPLPTLYMADGLLGLHIVLLDLKAALDAGTVAPMMVVAVDPKAKPEDRADEYLETRSSQAFQAHETWLLAVVIPWAEHTMAAAPGRAKRFIGGVSNGADLALWLANKHPEMFAGALVHSPVGGTAAWVGDQAASQRWVVTGGTMEGNGTSILSSNGAALSSSAQLPRDIARSLERRAAPLRVCIGNWRHEGRPWRQLSGGSLVWLMGLGNFDSAQSPFEKDNCRNEPP